MPKDTKSESPQLEVRQAAGSTKRNGRPATGQAALFSHEELMSFAPGVTLREALHADIYVGTADALVAAGAVQAGQFPGHPGMRKVIVTIFADGTMPTGAPTKNHRRAWEPGAKRVQRMTKTKFRVSVRLSDTVADARRTACTVAREQREMEMRTIPHLRSLHRCDISSPPVSAAASNVIDLQVKRVARSAVSKEKDGARFLCEVAQGESLFLSHFYQYGSEKAALRLLKIAESGPDWSPKESYLGLVYVTEREVEFLRFMRQKGLVAAARQLMRVVNKPLPGEEDGWGKVASITHAPRPASVVSPPLLGL